MPAPSNPSAPRQTVTREFATWSDYMTYTRGIAGYAGKSCHTDKIWAGVGSDAEMLDLASRGWPDGMARVAPMLAPMLTNLAPMVANGSTWQWDMHGASWDAGEYMTGNPECWLRQEPTIVKPTVTLQLAGFVSSGVSTDAMIRRGAATVALALALERAGYAVRIERIDGSRFGSIATDAWIRVPLTDDNGGPMDVDRILYACAHPGAIRNQGFRVLMHAGGVANPDAESLPMPNANANPYPATLRVPALVWSQGGVNWNDPAEVTQWLETTFANLTKQEG